MSVGLPVLRGKPGRPRLSASRRKSTRIVVRFTEEQFERLRGEAEAQGIRLSELIRRRSLQGREYDDRIGDLASAAAAVRRLLRSKHGLLNT